MSFTWPTNSKYVTQDFGPSSIDYPTHYFDRDAGGFLRAARVAFPGSDGYDLNFHNGLDVRAYLGTPEYAMEGGTVDLLPSYTTASYGVNYGIRIAVTSRCRFTYWHVAAASRLAVGSKPLKGAVTSYSGRTGTAAAHCHVDLELLDPDGVWRKYNAERYLPAHVRAWNGASVPAGDHSDDPRITIMLGSVTPSVAVARVRASANTSSAILGTLASGAKLPYAAIVTGESISGNPNWFKAEFQAGWGYLSATVAKKV